MNHAFYVGFRMRLEDEAIRSDSCCVPGPLGSEHVGRKRRPLPRLDAAERLQANLPAVYW